MKYKLYSILFVLLLLSSGAVSAQPEYQFLTHDDIERPFVMHLPADCDESQPTPLLIVLHGAGDDSGINMMTKTAEKEGFILVYPEAASDDWDYFYGIYPVAEVSVNEVEFFTAHPLDSE
jgi:poly(3-hydroxybutyrate) depolymerase